jgi:hypothetical protein
MRFPGIFSEIREQFHEVKVTRSTFRWFGLILGGILIVFGVFRHLTFLDVIGILIVATALVEPEWIRPIHRTFLAGALVIGFFVSRLVLAVLYFGIFTLTKCLLVLFRKDLMGLRIEKKSSSYWNTATPTSDLTKMF